MLKIRGSRDRLIFNMGIPILVRHLYIRMGTRVVIGPYLCSWDDKLINDTTVILWTSEVPRRNDQLIWRPTMAFFLRSPRVRDAELWCLLESSPEQAVEQAVITLIRRHSDTGKQPEIYEFRSIALQWRHNERLKSPASRLFAQTFVQTGIKENIKVPCHWPL